MGLPGSVESRAFLHPCQFGDHDKVLSARALGSLWHLPDSWSSRASGSLLNVYLKKAPG